MRWFTMLAAVLVSLTSLAGEKGDVVLPEAPHAKPDARLVVDLTGDGEIRVGKKLSSLDEVAAHVRVLKQSLAGEGERAHPEGPLAVLRVDAEAPWRHVQWLLVVLAEQKVSRIRFAVRREGQSASHLDASLPRDVPAGMQPPEEILVAVKILSRRERDGTYGPEGGRQRVTKPFEVRYRFGPHETGDLDSVLSWAREAARAGAKGARVVGEIEAHYKVPFRFVAGVLDRFAAADLAGVRFVGPRNPSAEQRREKPLPYPTWEPPQEEGG